MPPAFVQSKGGTSNTLNSLGIAFTSNNTVGNLLVCAGVVNASTLAGLTITDSQGNAWTIALQDNWKSLSTFFMAYAPNCKAGANTVTIAQTGSLISGAISEYSGVQGGAPLDKIGYSNSGTGTWTSAASGTVTTGQNGELIVSAQGNSTGPASVTPGSGFSNLQNDSGKFVSIESQVQATAGAIDGTFTLSASTGACGVLTFFPSSRTSFNVWEPQGNTIPNTLAGGSNTLSNPNVLFLPNSVVLFPGSPSTYVFKMWANYNNSGGTSLGTMYFESADGLTNWTAYTGNPVSTGILPKIYFDGTTYHLFTNSGSTIIQVQTSTDGVTFGAASTVLTAGISGAWDETLYQLQVLDIVGGTWWGWYNGENHTGGQLTGMGPATSPDGHTWTKYNYNSASSPVAWHTTNWTFLPKTNGIYYAYTDGVNPGSAQNNYGAIYRASSPSVSGPWTQLEYQGVPTAVYYPTTATDFVTFTKATGLGDPSICVANGNIYLYYDAGIAAANAAQINAAIAVGYTPAQLVATYEGVVGVPISGAPQLNLNTLASDSGVGANQNPLAGNWTHVDATRIAQRISNMFAPQSAGGSGVDFWNPITWGNDQWSQVSVQVVNGNSQGGVALRQSTTGATTYYKCISIANGLGASTTTEITKAVAGTGTTLITIGGLVVDVGDTILGVVNGTNIYFYWNGIIVGVASDSSIASGSSGFAVSSNTANATDAEVNNWLGGSLQNSPVITASISGNTGVAGATVAYSGASSGSVTADGSGNYTLSGLINGSYTITPSLAGYTFSPASANETLGGTNITGVNFTATKNSTGSGDAGSFAFDYSFG
jgi:hypothetical protein